MPSRETMEILKKPLQTEKASLLTDKLNSFVILVDKKANKIQIKKAIQEMYGVNVISVNTMVYTGKVRQRSRRSSFVKGKTSSFKKAVINIAKGETIDFYGTV